MSHRHFVAPAFAVVLHCVLSGQAAAHSAVAPARRGRCGAVAVHPQVADSLAVARTVEAFHAALAAGDSARVLALLAPDVTILEAGGRESLADYRHHHLPADIGFARAVATTRGPLSVRVVADIAWVDGTSESVGTFEGRSVSSLGAELVVLARTPNGWLIRAIHWSSRRRTGGP